MSVHLVTGYAGHEHIKSEDQGSFNASFFGTGQYVMEAGNKLQASIIDNNTIRILDGDILMKGRHIRVERNTYEDVTIETGTAGVNRYDMIVMEYSKESTTGVESASIKVIKGEGNSGTPLLPTCADGDILSGAEINQMPLFEVRIEGVVLTEVTALFTTIPTFKTLAEQYEAQFKKACETHLNSLGVLDSMAAVELNMQEKQLAGALALKELSTTLKKSVSDGKSLVAGAITGKGIETAADASFETMAENIALIALGTGGSSNVSGVTGHMEDAYYEANSLGANWTGTLTNNAVNLAADGTYIVVLAYSQSISANYANVNFGCDWKDVQFPTGAEAALLHENGLDGISLFRVYKVTTGATAGAITATVQLWGHYDKKAALEVCVLN